MKVTLKLNGGCLLASDPRYQLSSSIGQDANSMSSDLLMVSLAFDMEKLYFLYDLAFKSL